MSSSMSIDSGTCMPMVMSTVPMLEESLLIHLIQNA